MNYLDIPRELLTDEEREKVGTVLWAVVDWMYKEGTYRAYSIEGLRALDALSGNLINQIEHIGIERPERDKRLQQSG